MSPAVAVAHTLHGVTAGQKLGPQRVRDRVRARFGRLAPLPDRPRLDQLLDEASLPLVYDEGENVYRTRQAPADTTRLGTLTSTTGEAAEQPRGGGTVGQRLRESVRGRSFLALGVDAARQDRAAQALAERHHAVVLDVTRVLVEALRERAATAGVP